jgi:hypothetical protein
MQETVSFEYTESDQDSVARFEALQDLAKQQSFRHSSGESDQNY